jgi:hypothetical protein
MFCGEEGSGSPHPGLNSASQFRSRFAQGNYLLQRCYHRAHPVPRHGLRLTTLMRSKTLAPGQMLMPRETADHA